MDKSIGKKTVNAAKWSFATQIASRLISPVTQLVLAHILAPEVFGVVALVTMVTSFADMFSDAGFQKYLIQHEYSEDQTGKQKYILSTNVAFWTNLSISFALWAVIAVLRDPIASFLGDSSMGLAIVVACASLPLTAAISVQTAVYQRFFDFKTLFYSRVGSSLLIFLVSVPLAVAGLGYWSLIVGTLISNAFLAVWLTTQSIWRPSFQYKFKVLVEMFSFSAWTLVESFSIWATNWVGAFVLGSLMSTYYVGLFNTSTAVVNAVLAIITGAVNPVAFASLSRFQEDREKFDAAFYLMQKYLGFALVPIATCLFVFRDFAVEVLLGSQWLETSLFLGLYALASAFVVVFCHQASNAYRALGKPKLSLLAQMIFLVFYVPALIFGAVSGFEILSVIVPLARVVGFLLVHFLICKFAVRLSPLKMLGNLKSIYLVCILIGGTCFYILQSFDFNYMIQVILLLAAIVLYVACIFIIKDLRNTLFDLAERFGFISYLKRLIPSSLKKRWQL